MDLQGIAIYTGTTTVQNNASFKALLLSGPLVVQDGGTLAVSGTQPATLTVPSLALGSTNGANATFRLATTTTSDSITAGAVTLTGTNTINLVQAGFPTAGAYPLINYSTLTGGVANLVAGTSTGDYDISSFSNTGSAIVANLVYDPDQWQGTASTANWSAANLSGQARTKPRT